MIKINDIKTKEDILKFMDLNINYGWIDINGKRHVNTMKEFRKIYITSSIEDTIKNKLGTCIEQVALMKYLCDNANIKAKMFCTRIYEKDDYNQLEENEHMHCFLLVYENDKVYHIEHPNYEKKGIYEYKNEEEAITKINEYYINLSGGISRPVTLFHSVPIGLSFKEFNAYINHSNYVIMK